MVEQHAWLNRFFKTRQLQSPDGRHLYAYRTTDDEFATLRRIVSASAQRRGFPQDTAVAAIFCLYSSEWLRRELQGGNWNRWQPLFDSLSADVSIEARTRAVERGLSYWKLEVNRQEGWTAYFASLVCEGGLPLQLLRHAGGERLRGFFRAALEDAAIFGGTPESFARAAERHQERLPTTWRSTAVFQLAGDLIARIRELQQAVSGAERPVEALNVAHPSWRERLPLQLSDSAAEALITGLVEDAAEMAARTRHSLRAVRILLPVAEGTFSVRRRLLLPRWIEASALAQLLESQANALPERLNLVVETPDASQPIPVAMATKQADAEGREGFRLEGDASPLLPECFSEQAVLLFGTGGARRFGPTELPGGRAADQLPWTFVERDGVWVSHGEGSTSTQRPEVRLVVPAGCQVETVEAVAEPIGNIKDCDRRCFRVTGTVMVHGEDWRCRIRTSSEEADNAGFRLVGARAASAFAADVFLGLPRLLGGIAGLPALEWRPRGTKAWRRWSTACLGEVDVRLMVADDLRFHDRVRVLPAMSRIELEPGDGGASRIRLRGLDAEEIGITPIEGVVQRVERDGVDAIVHLTCTGQPPGKLELQLRWRQGCRLGLNLPYPAVGARFLDRNGQVLPNATQVHVGRLGGLIAQALVPRSGINFALDVTFAGDDTDREFAHRLGRYYTLPTHGHEARLELATLQEELKLALAMSQRLDATMRIQLRNGSGRPLPQRELHVGRYDLHLVPNHTKREVTLAGLEPAAAERLRVELRPLLDLRAEPTVLGPAENGKWQLPPLTPGPWWVLGWDGGWCRTRPLLWDERGQIDARADSLEAALITHPESARLSALDKVIARLVAAPHHEEWKQVDACLDFTEHVPTAAFDLLDRLIESPAAAVTALLRAKDERRFERVWLGLEQLPFSWRLVPAVDWTRAVTTWWQTLRAQLAEIPAEYRRMVEDDQCRAFSVWIDRVRQHIHGLGPLFDRLEERLGLELSSRYSLPPNAETALLRMRREAANELARTERDFPVNAGHRQIVLRAVHFDTSRLPPSIWEEAPPGVRHRQAVLDGPVAAALASTLGIHFSRADVYDLRRLQAFDPTWFDFAFNASFSIAFSWALRTAPELLA